MTCANCGGLLVDGFDVHHVIQFKDLLENFLNENNINIDDIKINYECRNEEEELNEHDKKIIEAWKIYHKSHCQLILLCKDCHIKITQTR